MARTTRSQVVAVAAAAAPPSRPISDFTRVSKRQLEASTGAAAKKPPALTKQVVTTIATTTTTRKRKAAVAYVLREEEEEEEEEEKEKEKENVSLAPLSGDEEPQTPAKRLRRTEQPPADAELTTAKKLSTPQLELESKAKKAPAKSTPRQTSTKKTPAAKPEPSKSESKSKSKSESGGHQSTLEEYSYTSRKADNGADLIRLHKAFLKTALLHIAHNGRNAPIDIAAISPNIARNWGKRAVTVDDIRRCVAIETSERDPAQVSPFFICDYGRGKVCVEVKHEWARENTTINEARLCRQFEENVRRICAERGRARGRARDPACDVDSRLEDMPLSDLPRSEIVTREGGGIKANPLLAKGHRALSELKSDLAEKKQRSKEAQQQKPAAAVLDACGSRTRMSLLDRIRHKQLARANEPLPPSGPELQRRAALNRAADVAATISMLSLAGAPAQPRQAYTMALISDKLRDSLRVPISREEGMTCIRLIAQEVAPEWIKVVAVGGRENVVIQRNNQPVDRVLRERVRELLG